MSLDKITAQERATHFRPESIVYNFNIILHSDQYYGLTEITFYLEDTNFTDLKLDFTGTVQSINVNALDNPKILTTVNFLIFPKKYLQRGRNRISILYNNKYDTDKLGCSIIQDDELNQYVYTQFEPYAAHRVFPCFDQPNLKAKMRLSVVAPQDWIAVSNESPLSSIKFQRQQFKKRVKLLNDHSNKLLDHFLQNARNDTKLTTFDFTEVIPTYVYGFSAGPFKKIESSDGTVPMAIYGLKTSQQLFESYAPFIFQVSQKTMKFYQSFFGVNYPFRKYDQVFIRDIWFWAMQNAGMVTYDEYLILKVNPTLDDYYYLAQLVAHQLSHHWFGNYVTMDWWDDLWLNESFAQYISTYALDQVKSQLPKPLNPSGIYFRNSKAKGYRADESDSATHPIKGDVPDTDVAQSIFDPITYDKGASAIKQLMFLITQANFSAAITSYFTSFAWTNATLTDFLNQFKPYFPSTVVSIDTWMNTWLLTPSLNVFESIWDPSKQTSTQTLTLYQSAYSSQFNTLRCHSMQIAFFDQTGAITQISSVLVDPTVNPTTVPYDGSKQVAAVLVNYNDNAFLQNYMDYVSLAFFKANINKISDDFCRALIWFNVSALVRQSLFRVDEFATMIEVHLFSQPLTFLLDSMLAQLLYFCQNYTDQATSSNLKGTIFNQLYTRLQDPNLTSFDKIQVLSKNYILFAESDSQIMQLNDWLHGDDPNLIALPILDNDLSWQIVKKVFAVSQSTLPIDQKWKVFQYVYIGDSSTLAQQQKIACEAIVSSTQGTYDQLYESLKLQVGPSTATRQFITEGLMSKFNYELYYTTYRTKYFADLVDENVYKTLSYSNFQLFYQNLKPTDTQYDFQITQYQDVLAKLQPIPSLAAHCVNFKKIIDDLNLKKTNSLFNADSNLTLTKIRAEQRSKYIVSQSIQYNSHIGYVNLESTPTPQYSGFTQITFSLNYMPKLLHLDFTSANVKNIIFNGYNIFPEAAQNEIFIIIPKIYLKNDNTIAINYENYYDNDGEGCMAYIDDTATPSQHYTYTSFEPHGAHLFFPCFDQPDLKAYASFNVIVPSNWIAIGNSVVNNQGSYKQADYLLNTPAVTNKNLLMSYLSNKSGNYYVFKQTQILPTYLFAIAAGEYYSVPLDPAKEYNNIPMTLYSLASYKDNLDLNAPFIFEMTIQAIKYYQANFKVPYPFEKYDSVFCHEYSGGAMQNPGIVTFNDNYLYDANVAVQKKIYFGNVIAHECAHNWFGNYVTMKWWDDLWLNESFANFISYNFMQVLSKTTNPNIPTFSSSWAIGLKYITDAYHEDQMTSTTHPVRSQVANTNLASTYFDYITYRKGQTTLKQLVFAMQEANFFSGLQSYFANYAWKNTTIVEFLYQLNKFWTIPDFSLEEWKNQWLLKPSLNILTVQWDINSTSPNASLTVNQSNYDETYQQLRYHYVNISFFDSNGVPTTGRYLINNTAKTLITYDASKGVSAILVNDGHNDFVKFRFDSNSQPFFRNNINKITNIMTRMVIYLYLDQQVRDYITPVNDHVNSILVPIKSQNQDIVFNFVFNFLNQATALYILSTQRSAIRSTIFQFILQQLTLLNQTAAKQQKIMKKQISNQQKSAKKQQINNLTDIPSRKIVLADYLPVFCSTLDQIDTLQSWRQKNYAPLSNISISNSQAWEVIKLIYISPRYSSSTRLARYKQQQASNKGTYAELVLNTCLSLEADKSGMETIYKQFKTQVQSITVKSSLAEGWNNFVHIDQLQTQFKDAFFKDLPDMSMALSRKHFQFFYNELKPIDDNLQDTVARFSKINLTGSEMIGHMINIKEIIEIYMLRSKLYLFNAAQK